MDREPSDLSNLTEFDADLDDLIQDLPNKSFKPKTNTFKPPKSLTTTTQISPKKNQNPLTSSHSTDKSDPRQDVNSSIISNINKPSKFSSSLSTINTSFSHRKSYDPKTGLMRIPNGKMPKTSNVSVISDRVASARIKKHHELVSMNAELQTINEQQSKEIRLLKTIQKRQETSLRKYEHVEEQLPKLLNHHSEQRRIDKAQIRKSKHLERKLESQVMSMTQETNKKDVQIYKMTKIIEDKDLKNAEQLRNSLVSVEKELEKMKSVQVRKERQHLLEKNSLDRQLKAEKVKVYQYFKEINHFKTVNQDLTVKLRQNERALNDLNLYRSRIESRSSSRDLPRIKNTPTKISPKSKTNKSKLKQISSDKRDRLPKLQNNKLDDNPSIYKIDATKSTSRTNILNNSEDLIKDDEISNFSIDQKSNQDRLSKLLHNNSFTTINSKKLEKISEQSSPDKIFQTQEESRDVSFTDDLPNIEPTDSISKITTMPLSMASNLSIDQRTNLTEITDTSSVQQVVKKPGTAGTCNTINTVATNQTSKWGGSSHQSSPSEKILIKKKDSLYENEIDEDNKRIEDEKVDSLKNGDEKFNTSLFKSNVERKSSPTLEELLLDTPPTSKNVSKNFDRSLSNVSKISTKTMKKTDLENKNRASKQNETLLDDILAKPKFNEREHVDNVALNKKHSKEMLSTNPAARTIYNFTPEIDNLYRGYPSSGPLTKSSSSIKSKQSKQDSLEEIFKKPTIVKKNKDKHYANGDGNNVTGNKLKLSPGGDLDVAKSRKTFGFPVENDSFGKSEHDYNFNNNNNKVVLEDNHSVIKSPSQLQMQQFLNRLGTYEVSNQIPKTFSPLDRKSLGPKLLSNFDTTDKMSDKILKDVQNTMGRVQAISPINNNYEKLYKHGKSRVIDESGVDDLEEIYY